MEAVLSYLGIDQKEGEEELSENIKGKKLLQ